MAMSIFNSWAVNGANGPNLLGPQSANVIFLQWSNPFKCLHSFESTEVCLIKGVCF